MNEYGFQRLVLLNSAGYERAELPLDDAVSLVAPNNTGKTSLINALQFLLIIDKRRMDFGPHSADASRRFYFPNNSAYILLEVVLPEVGSVVMGCVGKGMSHDYGYFVYRGQLNIEDFRGPDGSTVQEPRLAQHFERLGKVVYRYEPNEFTAALYGSGNRRRNEALDFTVFKLDYARHASAYQRVLTRTLRLDKLKSDEVKEYLLEIFKRELPDANIDFKAEWDKAFAEVNAERAQYRAALALKPTIERLADEQAERLELRGRIIHFRPLVDTALAAWQQHYDETRVQLGHALAEAQKQSHKLDSNQNAWVVEQTELGQRQKALEALNEEHATLARRFALTPDLATLERQRDDAKAAYENQVARVHQANQVAPQALRRRIAATKRELESLHHQLAHLGSNLYLALAARLDEARLARLNRILSRDAMALPPDRFELTSALTDVIRHSAGEELQFAGLRLDTEGLPAQFSQRTEAELQDELAAQQSQLEQLQTQLSTAEALEKAVQLQRELEKRLREAEQALDDYRRFLELQTQESLRYDELERIAQRHAELSDKLRRIAELRTQYRKQEREHEAAIDTLDAQHRQIDRLRRERADQTPEFDALSELPHTPWLGRQNFSLDELAEQLEAYQQDCRRLIRLNELTAAKLQEIHHGGLTKYANESDSEREMERIIDFANHLAQEAEALARKERSAIVNVTVSLRELRDGLQVFKAQMRRFNRLISGRQLSDLKVFKIEPQEDAPLVEAIELLINTAEKADTGETFELFNQTSITDDAAITRAKDLLIRAGEARGCLRVENLFRLEFVVGKENQREEAFADIDSAASNGTVLMAKLVTGLALLHLMQDRRHRIRAVCYLDEASALDPRNQRNLIETAREFGFALIFASPTPQVTARYCVPISSRGGVNRISRLSWQILEPFESQNAPLEPA